MREFLPLVHRLFLQFSFFLHLLPKYGIISVINSQKAACRSFSELLHWSECYESIYTIIYPVEGTPPPIHLWKSTVVLPSRRLLDIHTHSFCGDAFDLMVWRNQYDVFSNRQEEKENDSFMLAHGDGYYWHKLCLAGYRRGTVFNQTAWLAQSGRKIFCVCNRIGEALSSRKG